MKFTAGFLAVVAAAAPALAIELTNNAYAVQAGQPFTLTWSDSEGPVTVTLKDGASTDLQTVEVLASGLTTTSFTWNPPSSLASGTYAFEVADSSSNSPNYSPQFTFQGSAPSASVSSTASSAATTAASSSASISTTLSSLTITSSSALTTASANSTAIITSTASGNSTTTSSSSSSTRTSTRTSSSATDSASTSTSTPVNTNDSQKLGSPLALILGTIVSLMIFN